MTATAAWLNGEPVAGLAYSRGLHYGDGVFRTLLKYSSQLFDFERQYQKIGTDAAALGLSPPPAATLHAEAETLSAGRERCVIKILLLRSGADRGYRPRTTACDRLLLRYPLNDDPPEYWSQGIEAFRCKLSLSAQPALAGIKHLSRLEQVLASREWRETAQEGILCDEQGAPVGGTRSNLFWVDSGVLHTPDLERCGVKGMMRDKILACADALGLPLRVGPWPWASLASAAEAFVTNSLIGIWPLRVLDETHWTAPGPVTRRLMDALGHPRKGE